MRGVPQFMPDSALECWRQISKGREMRKGIWLLACLLLATVAVSASEPAPQAETLMTMRVDGEIAIDTQGKVLDYKIATEVQPEIKALLDKAISGWAFIPVLIDGTPTAVKTKMRITLAGRPVDTGYKIGIDNVVFHGESAKDKAAAAPPTGVVLTTKTRKPIPKYPKYAVNGMVLVYVRTSPEGKIEEAIAAQLNLFNAKGDPTQLANALQAMEDNAVSAIRQWTVNVETHGKTPTVEDLTATICVRYEMGGAQGLPFGGGFVQKPPGEPDNVGRWRFETRGTMRSAPWLQNARLAQRVGVSDVNPGEMAPVASPVRLRDGVIGAAL